MLQQLIKTKIDEANEMVWDKRSEMHFTKGKVKRLVIVTKDDWSWLEGECEMLKRTSYPNVKTTFVEHQRTLRISGNNTFAKNFVRHVKCLLQERTMESEQQVIYVE